MGREGGADLRLYCEKALPEGWTLKRITRFTKADRHELEQLETGLKLSFPVWEWADWNRNRLVWAESGCLRAAKLRSQGPVQIRTLQDFNDMRPPSKEECVTASNDPSVTDCGA